jgi:hypothetical protein
MSQRNSRQALPYKRHNASRRFRHGLAALGVAIVLPTAVSAAPAAAFPAQAAEPTCSYASLGYSTGSIMTQAGVKMQCMSNGEWGEYRRGYVTTPPEGS